jgi:PAS domain S-box-containing protein
MYRLHGVKPGSLAGGPTIFFNFIHPEDRDIVREVQAKILQQHTLPDIDYRITRPDGKVRHLRQRGRMAVYSEGEMVMLVTLQDITTELLTAQKLAELRQQVLVQQAAQHQSEDMAEMGSWTWEPDGGKYVWSESLYTLLGSKPSTVEITQKHLMQAIHPEDRKRFSEELNLAVQEKRESRFEFRIVRLGEMRHVAASFSLITYGGKDLFLGTLQDITHHTRLQQELEQQARQTSSITDNMLDRVIITDTENTIRVWNRQCEQVYGLKREAVIGKNIFDVFPQLKNETDLQLFNRALAGETISLPASKAALRQEFHDLHMIPLRDDEDNVTGILHLLHDVTKERETQQRLHERLNFIESLMEASVDRILVMDRYMNYLYCNQQAAAYYGLRKDDLIGKNVLEVFPASVNDPTHDHFRRALKGETVHIPAIEGISEEHYYEVFLIPITNDAGTVTAVLWIHHDLSADIRMQKQLRKSDEILNNIQAVFVELDHDLHFRYLNPVAETSIGRPRSELMGRSLVEVFPDVAGTPGYEAIVHANNQHVKTGLEFYSVVFNRWVYMSAAPSADGVLLLFYDRQDIRETQQRLYEEHRRLEEAQVIGKIGSFEWSVGEEEVAWSDEMYRITGLEPGSEPVTLHFTDAFVHPEDYGHLKKLKEDSLHTPGLYQITHRIVLRDGTEKWVHHQFESVAGESGTVVRVHGTLQDITESKEFEKQIRENRELLNTTINSSLDMIQVFEAVRNERGKIVDFRYKLLNEEAKKWMGDAVGESLLQRQPGVVKEGIFDAFRQVVETGIPQQYEKHYAHEQFSGWFYQSVVKLADGVTTTTTNITKRKEAEAQLLQLKDAIAQKATDKYLTLFNSIDEAVGWFEMITDEAGKPVDFRLLEVNPAYSKMSGGLIAQEAVGRRAKELIPDLEPWWIDTFAKVAFGGESMRFEREIKGLNSWFIAMFHR